MCAAWLDPADTVEERILRDHVGLSLRFCDNIDIPEYGGPRVLHIMLRIGRAIRHRPNLERQFLAFV